jgi:DNA-binding Xre family transcriptional regulator
MDIVERINQLCKDKKIKSVYELSKITGVRQSTLQHVMDGNSPRIDTLERICQGLEITISEFFINDQIKQQISDDLYPLLLETMKSLDLPQDIKDTAVKKFNNLSDSKKKQLFPQLVKSMRVAENEIHYSVDGSLTGIFDKYKDLPDEHRKALALIIESLHRSH